MEINTRPKNSTNLDLFRLNRASIEVGISPNTLRAYRKRGLAIYKDPETRAAYVSRFELEEFIKARCVITRGTASQVAA